MTLEQKIIETMKKAQEIQHDHGVYHDTEEYLWICDQLMRTSMMDMLKEVAESYGVFPRKQEGPTYGS